MTSNADILHSRGHYRILQRTSVDGSVRYVVVDSNGSPHRYELSLDDAKVWLDQRMLQDAPAQDASAPGRGPEQAAEPEREPEPKPPRARKKARR